MSVDLFFTLQSGQSSPSINPASSEAGTTPAQIQGQNFIDLILARLAQNLKEAEEGAAEAQTSNENELLQSNNPALDKEPSLDLAKILALNEEIAQQVGEDAETFGLGPLAALSQALALNQQALDGDLKPLAGIESILKGLLVETEGAQHADILSKLQKIVARLEELGQGETPAFIATNLTPEQITKLKEQLTAQIESSGTTEISDAETDGEFAQIFIGLINIVAPKQQNASPETTALSGSAVKTPQPLGIDQGQAANNQPFQSLAARLNNLVASAGEGLSISEELALEELSKDKDFTSLIKQVGAGKPNALGVTTGTGGDTPPSVNPALSALQGWPFTLTGSLLTPAEWVDPLLQELGIQGINTAVTTPGNLTSLVTNAQSAAHAHSATQMVAATIQKNAANGENKSITLQLDPPDLGKVRVRLEFGHDKTMKAVMLVEKPETYAMLQRDAHVLERAIQEIGLDSGGGMEFELAQDGHDFSHDGGHDGDGSQGGGGDAPGEDTIETTMDWYVDPDTGLTRYDLLV